MAKCSSCGTTILFGGVKDGEDRFCNDECLQQGILAAVADQIPDDVVRQAVTAVHQGPCPSCEGNGPVDVYMTYSVWSALLLTSWSNKPQIGCRRCGIKGQAGSTVFSLLLGWWGFPWGLIMTPVQIARNLFAMGKSYDPYQPSAKLEEMVRAGMGAQLMEEAAAQEQAA